jgi:hypothetical protein
MRPHSASQNKIPAGELKKELICLSPCSLSSNCFVSRLLAGGRNENLGNKNSRKRNAKDTITKSKEAL